MTYTQGCKSHFAIVRSMKAVIVKSEKQTIPQFNAATGKDEPTRVVVTHVHFVKDDGSVYHSQTFAQRPEEIDAENPRAYFTTSQAQSFSRNRGERA